MPTGRERRTLQRVAGTIALAILLSTLALPSDARPSSASAEAIAVVGMTVTDLARSVRFFTEVLDFRTLEEVDLTGPEYDRLWGLRGARARLARMRLGREELELIEFVTPKGMPYPRDSRSNDLWFQHVAIVVADMDAAHARIRARVDPISLDGPQTLPPSNAPAAGISAFYFRDPDGHALELIHFPPGKGDSRWHEPGGRLFLGIDHTAIGVDATDASLAFYRDLLGLTVGGASFNTGIEQERLTGVDGARVRITNLRAKAGLPGIELLDYLAPDDGRAPPDVRRNDVMHWYTKIVVQDVEAASAAFRRGGRIPSSAVVTLPDTKLGARRAVVLHDPDRHTLEVVER